MDLPMKSPIFYGLKRLTLPQLVAAPSLTARFSPRFLRDTAVFPFEIPKGPL